MWLHFKHFLVLSGAIPELKMHKSAQASLVPPQNRWEFKALPKPLAWILSEERRKKEEEYGNGIRPVAYSGG